MPIVLSPPLYNEPGEPTPNRIRWTRKQCAAMQQSEILTGRYELIEGEIISKMGQNRPHMITLILIGNWLQRVFGAENVQTQGPIDVASSDNEINEPEPDVVATTRPASSYLQGNPGPADIHLLAEVSDSTLRFDLQTKAALYARAGIAEYWVADIKARRYIVHRQPTVEGYREVVAYAETESLAPLAKPEAMVTVADLLPPVMTEQAGPT
jgi:Uma2 family endonuclease